MNIRCEVNCQYFLDERVLIKMRFALLPTQTLLLIVNNYAAATSEVGSRVKFKIHLNVISFYTFQLIPVISG